MVVATVGLSGCDRTEPAPVDPIVYSFEPQKPVSVPRRVMEENIARLARKVSDLSKGASPSVTSGGLDVFLVVSPSAE